MDLTVEAATALIRDEWVRGIILQHTLLTIDRFRRNPETREADQLVQLDEGPFRAPHRVVEAVRADIIRLILEARERREGLLARIVR